MKDSKTPVLVFPIGLVSSVYELSDFSIPSNIIFVKTEQIDVLNLSSKADRYNPILFSFQKIWVPWRGYEFFFYPVIAMFFRKQTLWNLFLSIPFFWSAYLDSLRDNSKL